MLLVCFFNRLYKIYFYTCIGIESRWDGSWITTWTHVWSVVRHSSYSTDITAELGKKCELLSHNSMVQCTWWCIIHGMWFNFNLDYMKCTNCIIYLSADFFAHTYNDQNLHHSGDLVCENCSAEHVQLTEFMSWGPLRVCQMCHFGQVCTRGENRTIVTWFISYI